jgi:hypothetical protein
VPPRSDEAIAANGKINLLVHLEGFEGCDGLDAAKDDFRLGTQRYRQVQRAASLDGESGRKASSGFWIL